GTQWTPELLAQTAFGQGELNVTPIQMALIAATVANGGRVPTPYVAAELGNGDVAPQLHQPGDFYSIVACNDVASTMVSVMVEGVESALGDIREQIYKAEVADYKAQLKRREAVISALLSRLRAANPATSP